MSETICGKCQMPIHPSETGLRHYGHFTAHSEHRCIETLRTDLSRVTAELQTVRSEFSDEVIALITTEQASMSRLYEKHSYGINKVCNRLKLFVGDLLKKQKEPV